MLKNISNLGKQLSKSEQQTIKGGIDHNPQVPFGGCFDTQGDCHNAIINNSSLCCAPNSCGKDGEGWGIHSCMM
ncbi:hypothetical protein GCM10011344_36390 [Dokdonia pacifica]|uniref:Uncharacterized protein n=1 Tax=Dokdonia pacifica TaxID=1627892 RepID=A0A239AYI6_9FLAO|nr:hypothetical protein [Dokdonia pacifica]GGG32224.1 hypothetical protein GCM10011344_36390 [Dokdonia pacifica]SNS00038.1 hypothetical protein SAMN06265376_105186 [Dokdonia pacifica]